MTEFEADRCWLCMYSYVIGAHELGCKIIDAFGFCPFKEKVHEGKEVN